MKPSTPNQFWSLAYQQQRMMLSAPEVALRRCLDFWTGKMTPRQFAEMMTEKQVAFAKSLEKATLATIGGQNTLQIMSATLQPISSKASANAKRRRR